MKTKLITALRTALKVLENGTFPYNWEHCSSCNCGVVFCALTGKSPRDLVSLIPRGQTEKSTWIDRIGYHCPITGVPTNTFINGLFAAGLTLEDIKNLEFLSDPKVITKLKETGFTEKIKKSDKQHVIAYLRAWVDVLIEEGKLDTVSKFAAVDAAFAISAGDLAKATESSAAEKPLNQKRGFARLFSFSK
jgi:hypothetical protein